MFGGIAVPDPVGRVRDVVPLVLVTMAVAAAVGDLAADEDAAARPAAAGRGAACPCVAVGLSLLVQVLLMATLVGAVLALVVLVFTSLAIPACVLERLGGRAALRRSVQLVRRNILRVFVVTVTANGLALVAGPLLGLAVLFFESGTSR